MDYYSEYRSKLKTPEQAALLVNSGDWVDYSTATAKPTLFDEALAGRRDELFDVPSATPRESISYTTPGTAPVTRESCATGGCATTPPWSSTT